MKKFLTVTAASVLQTTLAYAQTERELESHVHGEATLNVAVVDSSVLIELNTPWNNLVGFEHSPQTAEQEKLVDEALVSLRDPATLLSFSGGDCSLQDVDIANAMADEHHDEHDDDHKDGHDDDHKDGHDDDHKDGHDDDHKDDHDDDHKDGHDDDHADDHSSEHSAVLVSYSFECANISTLKAIELTLFSVWSGFESLSTQLVGPGGQTLAELTKTNTVLNIEQVQ